MYTPSVLSLASFLLAGALGLSLGLAQSAQAVQCGDELTSGGTFVLDADLTCTIADPEGSFFEGGIVLVGRGTVLDLNGHTITCAGGLQRAIRMGFAQLRNGTIANCGGEGVLVGSQAVIEHMVFTHNGVGVQVEGGEGNVLRHNVAVENGVGFFLILGDDDSGADDNVLLNNLATRNNDRGFGVGPGRRNILIGNTASFNGAEGFVLNSADISVRGNVAEANQGPGFDVVGGYGEIVGNIATGNGETGFVIDGLPFAGLPFRFPQGLLFRVQENLARENGGDGFVLPATFGAHRLLQRNVALINGGHGIHVAGGNGLKNKVIDNTVVGHRAPFFDLSDDNLRCRGTVWRKNTFDTASQICIR